MLTRQLIWILVLIGVFVSCKNSYQKALKTPDTKTKLEMADYYFNKKDFARASALYEQVEEMVGGTQLAKKVLYRSAQCSFGLKQYGLAGFQFKTFFENYPTAGDTSEEALYMTALCQYLESQDPELDQTDTYKAIETIKIFFSIYPDSKFASECNNMIDKLRAKLSEKSYRIAKLYYNMGEYKSAIVALRNTVNDFPEIAQKEEIDYLIVKSNFLLASNSVAEKQEERYKNTLEAYEEFFEEHPDNLKYRAELNYIKDKSEQALKKISEKNINN